MDRVCLLGKYKAEVFNPHTHTFEPSSTLVISVAVEETFQNDHRVVNTRGSPEGRFTFSAAESGDHRICFTPAHAGTNGGWLANGMPVGGIKLSLDLATGETSQIESTDKGKLSDIVQRVKDLNARLHDIRREQVFQRVWLSLRMMPWGGKVYSMLIRVCSTGTGSRVQRSVRDDECPGSSMDTLAACGFGAYLCMATHAFTGVFHQTKTHLAGSFRYVYA